VNAPPANRTRAAGGRECNPLPQVGSRGPGDNFGEKALLYVTRMLACVHGDLG
jgi:hypothetical protein